ncbi:archaean signal peptidase [Methanothermus fervidus DSM 2088]|uniref:Signal peptidase I n=1 Tax=Methanothermus fervidus (strain ATCC 43054 / DSM 2088 / JCM 10308 / V24 S) TaxID=523846 RepID=E3GWZ4_METFV|nr:signal peptidase I [Methanothermus fervidus]ADP76883.1 archaean signal peptidase [Methanothermus fervidus DSM 2088]
MKKSVEDAIYVCLIIVAIILSQHMNVVVSGSMEPTFYRGDIVLVQKADFFGIHEFNPENLHKGDIIVYRASWFPEPVIHRIIYVGVTKDGEKFYITKGDNNPAPDPLPVYPSQVVSKVIEFNDKPVYIPKIGYITLWLKGM